MVVSTVPLWVDRTVDKLAAQLVARRVVWWAALSEFAKVDHSVGWLADDWVELSVVVKGPLLAGTTVDEKVGQ